MTKLRTGWVGGAVLVMAFGSFFPSPGLAHQPSADQRSACMGDTLRLCSSEVPNVSRIIDCLARQKSKVSPRCRAYFDKAGL
jgi:hypothetical protein